MKVAIIGGGILGLATAYRLQQVLPDVEVTVLEKEPACGQHQTGHNSGVLHCGLYYRPGSRRAKLARRGLKQMVEFCREHDIMHEVCGKVVVATEAEEIPRLEKLFERGQENGLEGLKRLTPEELREHEPHVAGLAAIHVPEEGIADFGGVVARLQKIVTGRGGQVVTGARVERVRRDGGGWQLEYPSDAGGGELQCDFLVGCAGLHSDRVAALTGRRPKLRIVPFRGEYYLLRPERRHLVRNLIYPVPDPRFPFLGVHFTRRVDSGAHAGGVEAGPNAVLAFAREGYKKTDINFGDLAEAVLHPALWRFLARYPGASLRELMRSLSPRRFCASLQRLIPEIELEDLEIGGSGVRAQAMTPQGTLVDDFEFAESAGELHVLNAPSPGATASLAIGEEIARRVAETVQQ